MKKKNSSTDPVTRYALDVSDGGIIAGPMVRLACARHLRDLDEQQQRGIVWNQAKADRAMRFFSKALKLNGGDFEDKPFHLELWEKFIVGSIFGWESPDGYRRFRVVFIEIGKGNGKSPLAAGIGLYMLTADGEQRAEVYAAAVDKNQAAVLFRDAVAMRDQSPDLRERIVVSGAKGKEWNLAYHKTSSFFRPIASESRGRGKSGIRPHCALLDEVHEHPTNAMVEFMRAGTKGRKQALILMITNSGFDRTTVCYQQHDYAHRILKQEADDEGYFSYVCGLDEDDQWDDERVWIKANPNLGVSIDMKYLREQVREAKGMPSKQSIVKRLNFCVWVDAESPWIDGETWRGCLGLIDHNALRAAALAGRKSFGGLDLSSKNDLTAFTLVFPGTPATETVPLVQTQAITFFWTPKDNVKEREDRDKAPYARWIEEGHLLATPGKAIDYEYAAHQVVKMVKEFGMKEMAFDRWRMDDFIRELEDLPITFEVVEFGVLPDEDNPPDLVLRPHGQGFKDMGPAVDLLETDILNSCLRVEINPVMNMCSANAVLTTDPAGSRKFDKRESRGRIDGIVSLAMAKRCSTLAPTIGKSFWE